MEVSKPTPSTLTKAQLIKALPFLAVAAILVCLLVVMCQDTDGQQQLTAKTHSGKPIITVATVPTLDCLPLFVAYERRYADTLGYRLHLQRHLSLADCDTAFRHRSVCATPSDYIHAQRLVTDSTILLDNPNAQLIMFLNKRARLKEAKQLTDKMVACDRKGVSAVIAQHVLDSVALKNDKTFLVNFLDLQLRYKMLENNEMDAVILTEPQASLARAAGNPTVYQATSFNGQLIGRFALYKHHSDVIRQLYNRACDSLNIRGIHAYDTVIVKHLYVPKPSLKSLPQHKFSKL